MQGNLIPFSRMKKTLVALSIGTSLLVTLSSCSSTDEYAATDSYVMGDGEIPPWLLEGSEDEPQVAAGFTSQNRNDTYIPDETELTANVNAQFEALAKDGTLAKLGEKYPKVANSIITDFADQK